ncbi:MAG: hypothetical protein GY909_15265 [Oligoflexia bacterium]|nr:hypothetical protein [Oligoflexia bacterium]
MMLHLLTILALNSYALNPGLEVICIGYKKDSPSQFIEFEGEIKEKLGEKLKIESSNFENSVLINEKSCARKFPKRIKGELYEESISYKTRIIEEKEISSKQTSKKGDTTLKKDDDKIEKDSLKKEVVQNIPKEKIKVEFNTEGLRFPDKVERVSLKSRNDQKEASIDEVRDQYKDELVKESKSSRNKSPKDNKIVKKYKDILGL